LMMEDELALLGDKAGLDDEVERVEDEVWA